MQGLFGFRAKPVREMSTKAELCRKNQVCPFFFLVFLGLHLQHMEIPRLGVTSELSLLAYTTTTATLDQAESVTYTTVHGNAGSPTH